MEKNEFELMLLSMNKLTENKITKRLARNEFFLID